MTFNGDDIFLCYIKLSEECGTPPKKKRESIGGGKKSLVFARMSDVFEEMSDIFARISDVLARMSDILRGMF